MVAMTRIDFHTHVVVDLPDFAARYGDSRWPSFAVDGDVGRLSRDGKVARTLSPAAWSAARRVEDMEMAGIDVQVISPIPPLVCDWPAPEQGAAWCAHINEGVAAMVAAAPGRFVGLGTVPLQHPGLAAASLEHAHRLGLAGVEIGTDVGGRELDDPALSEFFATASRLGMIVFVHPLILGDQAAWTGRIAGAAVNFGLGMTTETAIAAARLVFGGVTARYPELRICLSHGGGTFFWAFPRIARMWDARGEAKASDLVRHVYVDSVVYEPENLQYLCQRVGPDRVVFGTDYPLPAQDSLTGETLSGLGPDATALVGGGTAARLLGL
jgi:aminocarboxymuconate-semialdehyde decarboxylase